MLRSRFVGIGILSLAATAMLGQGCGSKVSGGGGGAGGEGGEENPVGNAVTSGSGSTGSGTGGGGAGGSGTGGSSPACNGGADIVLAMDHILLGDTTPDGTASPTAWKQYGLNLDGLVSTSNSVDLCKPAPGGAPAAVYPDGDDGIDNSFGKNVLPILMSLTSNLSAQTQASLSKGALTYIVSIANLGADASCSTQSKLYQGAALGKTPLFDGSDTWPIDPASLNNPADPASAKNVFSQSTVTQNIYDSGLEGNVDLVLSVSGYSLHVPIHHARLRMQLAPAHDGATAGQLGGVIGREELTAAIAKLAATFDVSFCDPNSSTLKSIQNQMRQAADILQDGSQNPALECDGISIGVGFTMKPVKLGPVAKAAPPPPDPCGP